LKANRVNQQFHTSHLAKVDRLCKLARLLDAAVVIPGTNFRLGLDALLGLAPGIGDAIAAGFGGYLIYEAARLGVPKTTLLRMVSNLGIDLLAGSIPILGDLFDAAWRSNLRNTELIAKHVENAHRAATRPPRRRSLMHRWLLTSQ
jgi:hypothetical protein